MSFFHFGELWFAGSHGGGITSGMSYIHIAPGKKCPHTNHILEKILCGEARWAVGIGRGLVGQSELASHKAVWWDLHLASLLMHLFLVG